MIKRNNKTKNDSILTEPYLLNKEELKESKSRKILFFLEIAAICIFSIIMLILLCNRTFFTTKYKTRKLNIDIPLMMFYKSDDGNTLTLKTLRKTRYIEEFFNEELSNLTKYNCNGYSFYYDENTQTAIYGVKIKKDFGIKKVTISYANGSSNCLCNANTIGKNAEEKCLK